MDRHEIIRYHDEILNLLDYVDGNESDDLIEDDEDELNLLMGNVEIVSTEPNNNNSNNSDSVENILRADCIVDPPSTVEPSSQDVLDAISRIVHDNIIQNEIDIDVFDVNGLPVQQNLPPEPVNLYPIFRKPLSLNFKKIQYIEPNTTFCGPRHEPVTVGTPFEYFSSFLGSDIFQMISDQSNLYAAYKDHHDLHSTPEEYQKYFGVLLYTALVKLHRIYDYWSTEFKFANISDNVSRTRFLELRKYFHLADNTQMKPRNHPQHDKLFKVRPLLEYLQRTLKNIPPVEKYSVDEQVIPFKGRSTLKMYLKNKPHKWGFKVFTRSTVTGIIVDFAVYEGQKTCPDYDLGASGNIVLYLCKDLSPKMNHKIYCDNWFSSLNLAAALLERGITMVGTIRSDRMGKCPLLSEKDLKREGRGSFDHKTELNNGINLVRWFDKKAINFISTYTAVEPLGTCQRWDAVEKKKIDVQRPKIVKEYNKYMGGVDLSDMLLEIYRIDLKSTKSYFRIVNYVIGVAIVNSWLLYREDCKALNDTAMPLVRFQANVARTLISRHTSAKKRGRPSVDQPFPVSRQLQPTTDTRYDDKSHLPVFTDKKRWKFCVKGITTVYCQKSKVNLCFVPNRNCFSIYHTPPNCDV